MSSPSQAPAPSQAPSPPKVRWCVYQGPRLLRSFARVEDAARFLEEGLGCFCEDDVHLWRDGAGGEYALVREAAAG